MTVPQITIRLLPEMKREFESYAQTMGLKASELAKLLVVREKQRKQLARAKERDRKQIRQERGRAIPMESVTAHLSTVKEVEEFDFYIKSCDPNLSRDRAGRWLLEKELENKWLRRAIRSR